MLAPIATIQPPVQAGSPLAGGGAQAPIQIADRPQIPTSQDQADFARAAAQSRPVEVPSSFSPSSDGLGASLAHQVDQLAHHLASFTGDAGPAASGSNAAPAGKAPATLTPAETGGAVAQMEQAYMFAIETTMASRGSTESTKIFNTLLKGQ